jgi:hypothetical protein
MTLDSHRCEPYCQRMASTDTSLSQPQPCITARLRLNGALLDKRIPRPRGRRRPPTSEPVGRKRQAAELGVHVATLYRWLGAGADVSKAQALKVATQLGVPEDQAWEPAA